MLVDKILGFLDNVLQLGWRVCVVLVCIGVIAVLFTLVWAVVSVLLLEVRKFATKWKNASK